MYKLETSPLTVSGVFKSSWKLYKSSVRSVFVWSLIIAILHVIPFLFRFVGFYQRDIKGDLLFSWVGLVLFLILLLVEAFFLILFFYGIYSIAKKQEVDFPSAVKVARNQMVHLYLAMIAYFAVVNLGMILFILPAIFLGILFSMVLPFIVTENTSVYKSFDRSARIVWGHWWQTFCVLVIPYAIMFIFRSLTKLTPWLGEWIFLGDILILTMVMPYFYSIVVVQFNNLKIIKALPEPISHRSRTSSQGSAISKE